MSDILLDELRGRLSDPALCIVDVLPRDSWLDGHIPGAVNLPLQEIPAKARQLLPDPAQELAVYCASAT